MTVAMATVRRQNKNGFAFPFALLVAVQITTFTWAATNLEKKPQEKVETCSLYVESLSHTHTAFTELTGSRISDLRL